MSETGLNTGGGPQRYPPQLAKRRQPAATDQRGGRVCVSMQDYSQRTQFSSVPRRPSSNLNTPIRTAAITASRLDPTSSFRRKFVE